MRAVKLFNSVTKKNDKVLTAQGGGIKSKESRCEQPLPPISSSSDTAGVVFSSQKSQFTDYLTWKGIETKTGIQKHNTIKFLTKEFLDNSLDYLETQHNTLAVPPEIHVIIKRRKPSENVIRIAFCNSNYDHTKAVFSKQRLESIFDFDRYYSSKRNQFKITKGALGDAMKEMFCIPHALAYDSGITDWNYPLNISIASAVATQQKLFQIHLAVNRINQVINSKVSESTVSAAAAEVHRYGNTEIELTLPIIDDDELLNEETYSNDLYDYLTRYAILTTHIKFTFEDQNIGGIRAEFRQIQPINTKWKNQSSGYYYTGRESYDLILGLEDNDSTVYSLVYKTFREASNMPKSELTQMTVGQLKHSPTDVDKLFDELRKSMSPPTTLTLPFDTAKKVRKQALEERVIGMYGLFTESKYKSAFGFYSDGEKTQIPFFFEIAIFHNLPVLKQSQINLRFIQAINGSPIPSTGYNVFGGSEFYWTTPGSKYRWSANRIQEIFEHYGYSNDKDSRRCKKPHSLIIANLVCPKIEYESYGKSRINFRPFADLVAQTTVSASMGVILLRIF
jgi:hypothetical protein